MKILVFFSVLCVTEINPNRGSAGTRKVDERIWSSAPLPGNSSYYWFPVSRYVFKYKVYLKLIYVYLFLQAINMSCYRAYMPGRTLHWQGLSNNPYSENNQPNSSYYLKILLGLSYYLCLSHFPVYLSVNILKAPLPSYSGHMPCPS